MKERKDRKHQMSESYRLGMLLALVGGYLDAYTYVSRGGVFANAQTGNILLLGMNLADGKLIKSIGYLIPILAFVGGVLLTEYIKDACQDSENISLHWRQIIILVEIGVLLAVSFVPQGPWNLAVNTAISFVSSIQVESFRKVRGNAYATTMCTGNLRSAAELWYHYKKTSDQDLARISLNKSMQYFGIILLFIAGAIAGMFLTRAILEKSALICAAILVIVFLMMFMDRDSHSVFS